MQDEESAVRSWAVKYVWSDEAHADLADSCDEAASEFDAENTRLAELRREAMTAASASRDFGKEEQGWSRPLCTSIAATAFVLEIYPALLSAQATMVPSLLGLWSLTVSFAVCGAAFGWLLGVLLRERRASAKMRFPHLLLFERGVLAIVAVYLATIFGLRLNYATMTSTSPEASASALLVAVVLVLLTAAGLLCSASAGYFAESAKCAAARSDAAAKKRERTALARALPRARERKRSTQRRLRLSVWAFLESDAPQAVRPFADRIVAAILDDNSASNSEEYQVYARHSGVPTNGAPR